MQALDIVGVVATVAQLIPIAGPTFSVVLTLVAQILSKAQVPSILLAVEYGDVKWLCTEGVRSSTTPGDPSRRGCYRHL